MRHFLSFILDSGRWGVASEVAALVALVFAIVEHFRDRPVAAFLLMAATVVLFWGGAYAAWSKKREALEKIEKERTAPKLYLRYEESHAIGGQSGFFVGVEGEQKAFRVTVKSEEAVSMGHKRTGILWEVPAGMIGTDAVPIDAMCVEYKGDIPYPRGGLKEEQVKHFFDYKSGIEEMVVTVSFLDVYGREWSKQFKVYRQRINSLEKRIVYHPVSQAAS